MQFKTIRYMTREDNNDQIPIVYSSQCGNMRMPWFEDPWGLLTYPLKDERGSINGISERVFQGAAREYPSKEMSAIVTDWPCS
jgi:hypothetical protein